MEPLAPAHRPQFQLPAGLFYPVWLLVTLLAIVGIVWRPADLQAGPQVLLLPVAVVLLGLVLSLVGSGWGAIEALGYSRRDGVWYLLFPPYILVFGVRKWSFMAQPTLVFASGLLLAVWGMASVWQLSAALAK